MRQSKSESATEVKATWKLSPRRAWAWTQWILRSVTIEVCRGCHGVPKPAATIPTLSLHAFWRSITRISRVHLIRILTAEAAKKVCLLRPIDLSFCKPQWYLLIWFICDYILIVYSRIHMWLLLLHSAVLQTIQRLNTGKCEGPDGWVPGGLGPCNLGLMGSQNHYPVTHSLCKKLSFMFLFCASIQVVGCQWLS